MRYTASLAAALAAFSSTQAAHAANVQAAFLARSYAPGQPAALRIDAPRSLDLTVTLLHAGAAGGLSQDPTVAGAQVEPAQELEVGRGISTLRLQLGDWGSGVYFARLTAPGASADYAPFVLRPRVLGERTRVLVVEPTNTWQAYNFDAGDSWYEHPSVHAVTLDRPYAGRGLPPHFAGYDLGFLRWYDRSGAIADFVADDDLERFTSGTQLRRLYDLIVFPGHEEYVTAHVYDVVTAFRNGGGNLAFLSADNFFYAVGVDGETMTGRTRWRDLGRPEAALVGAQYAGWELGVYPNRPYRIGPTSLAPWLFAGTHLHEGSLLGRYGIEVDEVNGASPRGVRVLARIPAIFGRSTSAEMTYYRRGRAQVFDAGVMNFGGSADWPVVSTLLSNLWNRLAGSPP